MNKIEFNPKDDESPAHFFVPLGQSEAFQQFLKTKKVSVHFVEESTGTSNSGTNMRVEILEDLTNESAEEIIQEFLKN